MSTTGTASSVRPPAGCDHWCDLLMTLIASVHVGGEWTSIRNKVPPLSKTTPFCEKRQRCIDDYNIEEGHCTGWSFAGKSLAAFIPHSQHIDDYDIDEGHCTWWGFTGKSLAAFIPYPQQSLTWLCLVQGWKGDLNRVRLGILFCSIQRPHIAPHIQEGSSLSLCCASQLHPMPSNGSSQKYRCGYAQDWHNT
jgi:hypothetical protein